MILYALSGRLFVVWAGKGYSFPIKLFATSPGQSLGQPPLSCARATLRVYKKMDKSCAAQLESNVRE